MIKNRILQRFRNVLLVATLVTVLSVLGSCSPSHAYAETFVTGRDWVQKMSIKEKFMALVVPMNLFHRYGVDFRKTPPEYIRIMDNVLFNNPYIESEDVANILASIVYFTEPESRAVFRLMQFRFQRKMNFLNGNFVYDSVNQIG